MLFDSTKIAVSKDGYVMGETHSVVDQRVTDTANFYKRAVASRFTPLTSRQLGELPDGKYHVSLKLDGGYYLLYYDEKETPRSIFCNAPKNRGIHGLPVNAEIEATLKAKGIKEAFIITELYVHDNQRTRVHHLTSALASATGLDKIHAAVHDLWEIDGVKYGHKAYHEIYGKIREIFAGGKLVHPVPTVEGGKDLVAKQYHEWVEVQGQEGVVARKPGAIYKVKPVQSVDAAIVGFAEGNSKNAGKVGTFLTALMRTDGTYQVLAQVGGGLSDDERDGYFKELSGTVKPGQYTAVTSDGRAFKLVEPKAVIEVEYLAAISEDSRGDPISQPVLAYVNGRWETRGEMPLVSLISPRYLRRRDDKGVNTSDLRLEQLTESVEVEGTKNAAKKIELQASTILEKKVATKGGAVRKVVLLKTNKPREAGYTDYLVFATDFSPARQTPLDEDVVATNDRAQAEAEFTRIAGEQLKKGWTLVQNGASGTAIASQKALIEALDGLAAGAPEKTTTAAKPKKRAKAEAAAE